jgi:uncharacterized protein
VARVVVDTGVIVSALLKKDGTSRKAFTKVLDFHTPLLAFDTLIELERTLAKPKFERLISVADRVAMLELLLRLGEVVNVIHTVSVCRDSSDDKFLNLALSGGANVILSRDPDLLTLHPFHSIPILLPADFLKEF